MVNGELLSRRIKTKDTISLMNWWDLERNRPEAIGSSSTSDENRIIFKDADIETSKNSNTVVVAELG